MTFGNAWGQDGLSYNGKDMRYLVRGMVYGTLGSVAGQGDLAVSAQSTPGNTVRVAAGSGYVNATGAGLGGLYHVWNDGFVNSPAFTATGADPRTDRVIVRVIAGVPTVQVVQGTPGPGTPAPPTVTGDNYLTLARVQIPAATATVTNAMIVDERAVVGHAVTRVVSAALPFLSPAAGDLNYEPDTGRIGVYVGPDWRYLPQRYTAAGTVNANFAAEPGKSVAVSYGVTFDAVPVLNCTAQRSDANFGVTIQSITTSGAVVTAWTRSGNFSGTVQVHWQAVGDLTS